MPLLFSYGTLQQSDVQLATFGRRLVGKPDALLGFEPSPVAIRDSLRARACGRTHSANITNTGEAVLRYPRLGKRLGFTSTTNELELFPVAARGRVGGVALRFRLSRS